MINKFLYLYSFIRLLSIDIVLGVLAGGIYASRLFRVDMPLIFWFLLLSTVWMIYIADHLADGMISSKNELMDRYDFYFRYRKLFIGLLILLILINGYLFVLYLDKQLKVFGLITCILVLIYFLAHYLLNNSRIYLMQKEVLIAVTYTYGIFGGPMWIASNIKFFQLFTIAGYLCIIFTNVLICSVFNIKLDRQLKISSLATTKGTERTKQTARLTLLISLFITIIMILNYHLYFYGLLHLSISTILLIILIYFSKYSISE